MSMILAYHFLKADMHAGEGRERAWKVGESRTIKNIQRIAICKYGYHASPTLWNALPYAPGPMACLVEVDESLASDDTKSVHASRKLIAAVNIERELRLFAADCAEHVLYIFECEYPNDDRPRRAIQVRETLLTGKSMPPHGTPQGPHGPQGTHGPHRPPHGPPHGPPQGPPQGPQGTPHGPQGTPHGPQGTPQGTPQGPHGPPHGPQGPPQGPHGPPSESGRNSISMKCSDASLSKRGKRNEIRSKRHNRNLGG